MPLIALLLVGHPHAPCRLLDRQDLGEVDVHRQALLMLAPQLTGRLQQARLAVPPRRLHERVGSRARQMRELGQLVLASNQIARVLKWCLEIERVAAAHVRR